MDKERKNNLTKVLIFSGDSHVKEYDANILKNEIKLTNTLQNITSFFDAQKPELPTYNLQNPKSYSHFHVDLKNVKTVLIKNKNEDKCAIILYRDKTIKTKYRFTFLKQRNKMAFVQRYCNKKVKQQEKNCIKLYTNKKYLNEVSSKRKIPKNLKNNTNSQYRLKQILEKQLVKEKDKLFSANAVFDIKKASQKVFLSRDIKNRADIKKFVENIRKFNNTSFDQWQQKMAEKLKSLSINLSNILIIIQINNFTSNTYLNMGRNTARFKHVHKIGKKSFVNIKTLNIKLVNIKKLETKRDLNKLSSASESNLVVKNSMDLLTDQLKGATFKEMCKMLLKLQCNSKLECKKLYSSYSAFKKVAFNEEIFDVVQKVVSKFSAITRAQQNANIEITNLRHTLKGAVKSFERVQSSATKALILKKLESAIQEDDLLDPRILLPSDYKFFGNIVSKENISIQTEEEIEQQKEIEMIDFEVQHDVDIIKSAEPITQDDVYTIYTQTSQHSLNIMSQIASNISTQTAISIHKCTSIQFPGEHVQVRKNIIIHKIKNSLDQVKNMYEANNKIMKEIANCSANISLTNVEIKSNEEIKKEEMPKKKLIYEDIKKKNEAIINKVESMKMTVKDLKTRVDTDKNVVEELKDEADQMTVEHMKKKVDSVRLKVEDLKRQVDTQKIDCGIKELKKKEDEQPKEEVVKKEDEQPKEEVKKEDEQPKEEVIKNEDEVLNIEGMIINQAKNKEDLINQIKNTLNSVTERFKQNSLMLAEVARKKKDYKVAKNVNKIMKQPLISEESSASFKKALRQFDGSKHALNNSSYSDPQEVFSKNLNTSMKLLKNLNEITKKMKTQPKEATKKLMEIKQALIAQRKHLAAVKQQSANKIKYNKTSITLSPIKNHIHKNIKNLVSLNAIRALSNNNSQQHSLSPPLPDTTPSLANLPDEYLPKNRPVGNTALDAKLGKIMPNVHSKHILKFHERKDKKRQLYATIGYHRNTGNKSPVAPVVHTIKDNPLIAKIVRPIRTTQAEEVVPRLSQLSFSCVQRFTPEYPRKDHITYIGPPIQESYLYKLLYNETGASLLEPLVKCSSKDCANCVSSQDCANCVPSRPKTAPEEKIDRFDFKKYMYDPNLKHNVNFTVCPVDVTFNNKNSPKPRAPTKNVTSKKPSVTTQPKMSRTSAPLLKKNIIREETQNKIQKNIQQAILKNQEKFMILHSYIMDRTGGKNPKSYNIVNINPKVVTAQSGNKKPNVNNPKPKKEPQLQVKTNNTHKPVINRPKNKPKTGNPNKKVSSVAFFDKKYGDKTSLSSLESRDIPCNDNNFTQIELQNYITQVEQKFIHTFSMKEEEKANAYNNLTTEIEDMLDALKASGAKIPELKLTEKKSEPTDKSESTTETLSQKERIVDKFLTQPVVIHSNQSKSLESTLSESNTSKNSESGEWLDDSQAKKKIHKFSGPTIITDHINFNESLTAIKSKENSIFHVHSTSNCQSIDPVPIIRNCKSDTKVSSAKKVRHNLSSFKVDNMSDESLLTSIAEEEELSMCNDVTTDESSANTLSFPEIATEFQVEVYFKTTVHFSYSCEMPKETYYTAIWQDVYITEQPQVNNIRPMTTAYIKKYDIDVNKSSEYMSLKSEYSWDSIETIETVESDTSKDILNLPDSKFEIDAEYIEKYYSNLKLKELFTDPDESEATDEVIPSNSPRILEFLDMLTSLSKDDEVVVPKERKEEVYYKYNFYKPLISYPCYIYHETVVFDQVTIEMTYLNPFLDYSTALGFQSNQLQRLIDENHEKQNSFRGVRLPRFVSMPDYNLYSMATINSERKISSKHNLHDSKKSYSDTKFDLDEKFSTKRKMDSVCHNMFVNLQVNKKKRKINRLMKIAKRVVVNQITPLLKQTPKINDNFTFNLRPINTDISDVQKLALIFLYVTVFAFIFLCMTLNYSCE